ncbi:MAG: hypothetical protein LBH05_01090 [Deferribacteraceae bacterium]|jgi:hypothetical protein|nr:hypothetical protein [Deferribacteraceae bacterium]
MKEAKVAIGVFDAFLFSVSGFLIVIMILILVILSVKMILKIEKKLTKIIKYYIRNTEETEESEEMLDPLTLILISAAVGAVYGNIHMRRIRRIGANVRHAGAWGHSWVSQQGFKK